MKTFIALMSLLFLFSCSEDESFRVVTAPAPAPVLAKDCSYSEAKNFLDGSEENGSCSFEFCNIDNYENTDKPYYSNVIEPYLQDLAARGIQFVGGIDSQACNNKIGCKNTYATNYDDEAVIESELCSFTGCPEEDLAYLASFNDYISKYPNYTISRSCNQVRALNFKKIPSQAIATKAFPEDVEVEIRNVLGMVLTGNNQAQITLSAWLDNNCSVPATGMLMGTLTKTVVAGIATFDNLKYNKLEDIYLRAESGNVQACSNKITMNPPQDVAKVEFKQVPTATMATKVFNQDVIVEIKNVFDMVLTGNNLEQITVSAWIDNQCTVPATGVLMGTLTKTVVAGVATFNDLKHDKVENIYLRAQTGNLTACSNLIKITPPVDIDSLTFKKIPAEVIATKKFTDDVEVEIRNVLGMVITDNNAAIVTVSAWLDDQCTIAGQPLGGATSKTVVAGIATFNDLSYSKVEDIYLRAQSGNAQACSNKITVKPPADIAALNFKSIPAEIVATKAFPEDVEVELRNVFDMVITDNNQAMITLSAWTDDQCTQLAPGTLEGTLTRTVVAGVATFDDLKYDQPVDIYLRAQTGNITKCSNKIVVKEPTDIESVAFKAYPPMVTATETFPTNVEVEIKNFFENVITSNNEAQVTLTPWLDDKCTMSANGNLGGSTTETVVAGVATFDDLEYDTLENIYLRAESNGKTACSGLIQVYPPTDIASVHFIDIPTQVTEGMPFNYDVKVEVRNVFNMPITTNNTDQVTISAWVNNTCDASGMGVLNGTLVQQLAAGIATYDDLAYSANEDIYLKAEVMGKTTCSNLIDVLPKPEIITDNHTQMVNNKVDVVMLIDNSGSMGDEIANMKQNINLFVQEFVKQDVDYQFVTATTVENFAGFYAKPHQLNDQLKKANYLADSSQFLSNFQQVLQDYSNLGGSVEVPFRAGDKLLTDYPNYRRSDASLAVLVFGDEREQSTDKSVQQWYDLYKNYYEKVQVSCIVRKDADPDNRFKNMTVLGSGYYEDITDPNFHLKLKPIGEAAALLPKTFALSQPPVQNTIVVKLNGQVQTLTTDYVYNANLNTIIFNMAPPIGDQVEITYEKSMAP